MNKELTPLEALKELFSLAYGHKTKPTKDYVYYRIIETALKEYELMKQTKIIVTDKNISDECLEKLKNQRMFVNGQCEIKPLFDEETQNKLKAVEIIKKKPYLLLFTDFNLTYEEFVEDAEEDYGNDLPTKEEYELVKEVLL